MTTEAHILKLPQKLPRILHNLNSLNQKKKIKIRFRKLDDGVYSLYFDLWNNGKRNYKFLKLYIWGTKDKKKEDEETLRRAIAIRDHKELDLLQNDTGLNFNDKKSKADFIQYFESLTNKKLSYSSWSSTYFHLKNYFKRGIQFRAITPSICENFKEYLLMKVSNNSAHTYFARFKTALNQAVRDEIITKNPAQGITVKQEDIKREFLTIEDIQKLKRTPLHKPQVKNAFLFACFTGLRYSDIKALRFDQIKDGYLNLRQQKTKSIERIKLNHNALEILEEQKILNTGFSEVFNLPESRDRVNLFLRSWASAAGIEKHIHFHVSRHTYATMLLTYDVDLYTVSKLLGHKEIKTTQIYAKLIDKKKDEAIDRLPKI